MRLVRGSVDLALVVALGLACGCGGGSENLPTPAAASPPPAPPIFAKRLTIFVANAEVRGAASDPNYADKLRAAVEARFKAGGYHLVDVASPHDVTAHVIAQQDKDHPDVWNYSLRVDAPDGTVDQTTSSWAGSDGETVARLVDPLSRSERLVAFVNRANPPTAAPPQPAAPDAPSSPAQNGSPASGGFVAAAPQPDGYAAIVGIEKYASGLPVPTGARTDAERFAELARTSLGLSSDHVQLVVDGDATKGGIERALEWVRTSVPAGGRAYFYFSGHGAPDAAGGTPYIVPSDGDPKYLDATAIPMKDVLAKLAASKAREVLAVVDACFSGAGGRSVLPPGARPIVRVRDEPAPARLALFSASTGAEISGPAPEGGGGLFTKYVLEGLGSGTADMNGDGQISLGELAQWVEPRVAREAKKDNRDQNPSLTVGKGLGSADSFIVEWGLAAK